MRFAPVRSPDKAVRVKVDVVNNRDAESVGTVRLNLPQGWTAAPASQKLQFSRAGERATCEFTIRIPALQDRGLMRKAYEHEQFRDNLLAY